MNHDVVRDIKNKTKSWTPQDPDENPLAKYSHVQLHMMLGTRIRPPLRTKMPPPSNELMPKEFDARKEWKDCIHPVRN